MLVLVLDSNSALWMDAGVSSRSLVVVVVGAASEAPAVMTVKATSPFPEPEPDRTPVLLLEPDSDPELCEEREESLEDTPSGWGEPSAELGGVVLELLRL